MTILDLLERDGAHPAIEAPDRPPLSYRALREHIAKTGERLAALGIGRGDRVGIVLPTGAELATAFLAVSSCASSAPLNPSYRRDELEFYLADLGSRAVLTCDEVGDNVAKAAAALDVPILRTTIPDGAPAGVFEIDATAATSKAQDPSQQDDIALLLHTSGTTSRPKLVPLRHRNLSCGARNVASTLELGPEDRCLGVMPLFHIHGLVASVLATLLTGGTVVCTPGFNAFRFFAWLDGTRPTWSTAVPTMYQAAIARASGHEDVLRSHSLRVLRSSSSALPPKVMRTIEELFGIPAVEAYGMTEASHQMATNPLPPAERKAGCVGLPAGPDVSVMDEDGNLLGPHSEGEIVIKGPNVMDGYENAPEANATSFTNGWLRTGDQGSFDADGYLTISGRLKEIINRGGEKISPREIEDVLLDHDAVEQSVAFPMPHRNLGEDVAAAVVLRNGADATASDLRAFVREHLAAFKVPRKLLIVDEIPKGPTGKLQRLTLAETFGLDR